MNKIEKERKFILKGLPDLGVPLRRITIRQFYKDGWRYRSEQIEHPELTEPTYMKLRKVRVSSGHNQELDIETIGFLEFYETRKSIPHNEVREIRKTRHIWEYRGKMFEVDLFINIPLIMMEVEDVEMEEKIDFPPEIERVLLVEVTGNKNFDNYNLSI